MISATTNTGRHTTTDFVISIDGYHATQSCHLTELGPRDGGGFELRAFGRYEDELFNDGTGWRFRSRRLTTADYGSSEPCSPNRAISCS